MATQIARWRFTVEDYHRMAEAGILTEDDRVELIAGEVVEMTPIGGPHMGRLNNLVDLLANLVRREALISVQNPIQLSTGSEPQPDIALLRRDAPRDAVPMAADVLLVIEVADTSVAYDRNVKLPLYAAAGIPEAWLFDVGAAALERHSEPRDGEYRLIARARRGESLASTVLPAVVLPVDAILG